MKHVHESRKVAATFKGDAASSARWNRWKNRVGRLTLMLSCALFALPLSLRAADPLPTMGPDGMPPPPPPDYVARPLTVRPVAIQPSRISTLNFEPGSPAGGRVAVVVEAGLFASVSNSLVTYAADLTAHGFAPFVVTFSGSAEQLRELLAGYYADEASLAGAVLVGDLPYAVWEMIKTFDTSAYEANICDIFFMDLDGTWEDNNATAPFAAGRYDTRGGDLLCEIWVTRIAAENMSVSGQTAASLVNGYFTRNHAYRSGSTSVAKKALHYTDNDWSGKAGTDVRELSAVYSSVTSRVCGVHAGTGGADYRDNHLPSNVELIQVRCHGTAAAHVWDDGVNVTTSDYLAKDPHAVFYNLYTCSGGDFTVVNNLSRMAVMNPAAGGLAAWSHSGTGGMITLDSHCSSAVFYDALGAGECLGEAFRLWYNACVASDRYVTEPYWRTPKWFNGMRIDGDGCLTLRTPTIRYVSTTGGDTPPYTSWAAAARSVNAAFSLCGPGDIVRVAAGRYVLTNSLIFTSDKAITLVGTDPGAAAILDASQLATRDRCVYVKYGVRAVLENLTLTGGTSGYSSPNVGGYGGGARLEAGLLRGCVVSNNTAAAGGGLTLSYDARVENCVIVSNRATGSGGGFIARDSGVSMADTVVSNNVAAESGGGGITTYGGRYERCRFVDNQAGTYGGGLSVIDRATFVDACVISGNRAAQYGGGLYIHLGTVVNSLISANSCGTDGGGVNAGSSYTPGPSLTNVTITANSATGNGDGVSLGSNVTLLNAIVWGNGADDLHVYNPTGSVVSHCCLGEAYAGAGVNNLFADPLLTADYRLPANSPCVNKGVTPAWMTGTEDLAGGPRVLPAAASADIGAYEFTGPFGLFAAPGTLAFATYETYDAAPQTLTVCSDAASGVFAFCASPSNWLAVGASLSAGAAVSASAPLGGPLACQVAGLAAGHYAASVEVRTNVSAAAVTVPVTLDVLPLQTDALAFGPVASPQGTGVAFTVRLAACNAAGFTNRHHAADVALDAFTTTWTPVTQQVGAGTGTTEEFLYTYYHDSRSQMIFLASELGAAGNITNIAFYLTSVPSPATLSACTIRLKHTALAAYSTATFETAGWQTGYSANRNLTGKANTWVNLPIDPPFAYNGTQNLLVDFSFNNSLYGSNGKVKYTATTGGYRHYHGYCDSTAGDPLLWSGDSGGGLTRTVTAHLPNLRFGILRTTLTPVAVQPATLAGAAFAQGVWQGGVTIGAVRTNVTLRATFGAIAEPSNPFDVFVDAPPAGPIPSAWLAQFGLPGDTDPDGNPDGDAFTTEQEYVADTNPTNGASFLRVTAISNGTPVTVAFTPASTARVYTLQATTNLAAGAWGDVAGQGPRPGAGGPDVMSDNSGKPSRFFRVKVEVP